jgi:hypothetical protein
MLADRVAFCDDATARAHGRGDASHVRILIEPHPRRLPIAASGTFAATGQRDEGAGQLLGCFGVDACRGHSGGTIQAPHIAHCWTTAMGHGSSHSCLSQARRCRGLMIRTFGWAGAAAVMSHPAQLGLSQLGLLTPLGRSPPLLLQWCSQAFLYPFPLRRGNGERVLWPVPGTLGNR